jgi:hypothetical protein
MEHEESLVELEECQDSVCRGDGETHAPREPVRSTGGTCARRTGGQRQKRRNRQGTNGHCKSQHVKQIRIEQASPPIGAHEKAIASLNSGALLWR